MKKNYLTFFPLILFFVVIIFLGRGLFSNLTVIPSPLINKPSPLFQLPTLSDPQKQISQRDFQGRVTLFNVWATWCVACLEEHAFLMTLSREHDFLVYGLNYKDDRQKAINWLKKEGNPYDFIAFDQLGNTAIDWGVYGTPETFIIDKKGIIRYKHVGPITQTTWETILNPLIQTLQRETS